MYIYIYIYTEFKDVVLIASQKYFLMKNFNIPTDLIPRELIDVWNMRTILS